MFFLLLSSLLSLCTHRIYESSCVAVVMYTLEHTVSGNLLYLHHKWSYPSVTKKAELTLKFLPA